MKYETVIGLEAHVELCTRSKIFCGCATDFVKEPNTQVCPVCLGLPGALPVLNRVAVEFAIKTALALNCTPARYSKFDRKNYTYPDLPKAYQDSQYDLPISSCGYLDIIGDDGEKKRIGITRVHLEEDAGKLLHVGDEYSLVDHNRSGIPLIEIVSEPDLGSPLEAYRYMESLRNILQYIKVSDCRMEEGSLRCDANISLRAPGSKELGCKTELKNMNSFRATRNALKFEIARQAKVLESGGELKQETRRWSEEQSVTLLMRTKEGADDYRYFPEPDLPPLVLDAGWIEEIRSGLPELPKERCARYISDYGLPVYDAEVITSTRALADFFERCVSLYQKPKMLSNWIMGDLLACLRASGKELEEAKITSAHLVDLLKLIDEGTISGKIAKDVFVRIFESGESPQAIVEKDGLLQISDPDLLQEIVDKVITGNPATVEDYRSGKKKAFGFLVGQAMRLTKGKANPQAINELIKKKLV